MSERTPIHVFKRNPVHNVVHLVTAIIILVTLTPITLKFATLLLRDGNLLMMLLVGSVPMCALIFIVFSFHWIKRDTESITIFSDGIEGHPKFWQTGFKTPPLRLIKWQEIEEATFAPARNRWPAEIKLKLTSSNTDKPETVYFILTNLQGDPEHNYDRIGMYYKQWRNGETLNPDAPIPHTPNYVPLGQRVGFVLSIITLAIYIFVGLTEGELSLTSKGTEVEFSGIASLMLVLAFIAAIIGIVSRLVDHYDKRDNEKKYKNINNIATITALFFGGLGIWFM